MAKLFRVVVGYRDDLNLPGRWWHRLLRVVTVLIALVIAAPSYFITEESLRSGRVRYENVKFNAFMKDSIAQKDQVIELADMVAAGDTASCGQGGQVHTLYDFQEFVKNTFCVALDNREVVISTVRRKHPDEYRDLTDDQVYLKVTEGEPPKGQYACYEGPGLPCSLDRIALTNRVQDPLVSADYAMLLAATIGWPLLALTVFAALYHRVVLWVAFGSRRTTPSAAV